MESWETTLPELDFPVSSQLHKRKGCVLPHPSTALMPSMWPVVLSVVTKSPDCLA